MTGVMLIGFGGPEKPEEVRPFLESVLKGVKIPQERFDEVVHHYDAIGGVSPYNALTYRQKEALEKEFLKRGFEAFTTVGFRHSHPSFEDAIRLFQSKKITHVTAFVLASLRSHASFEKYTEKMEEVRKNIGGENVQIVYTDPFHTHPDFIGAQAAEVSRATETLSDAGKKSAFYIFSAHSIPQAMSEKSGYGRQFEETCGLIAEKLQLKHWQMAYQSRSGNPHDPWLEPDVRSVISGLDTSKFNSVVLIPSGFLCDNVEVIYDLDRQARETAGSRGLKYLRAKTVTDHPQFIRLVADLIQKK